MVHLWVRAEQRPNEERVGLMPDGVANLLGRGFRVTVEESATRVVPTDAYRRAGAEIAAEGAWPDAPGDAWIFGLKELPDDGSPLTHRHVMFGHAYKGQADGRRLVQRFRDGGGALYDLEYLVDHAGRRAAAFGYWAGFAGAALSLMAWAAQRQGALLGPVTTFRGSEHLLATVKDELSRAGAARPTAIAIGAKGRVGTGAADLLAAAGVTPTLWDLTETEGGGPFPEILEHDVLLNCILARPGAPVFVPASAATAPRLLSVVGDIACDPTSDFSPVRVYGRATDWGAPAIRAHDDPPLDVVAIDNLPSLLPAEASRDFAAQLLPHLRGLAGDETGVWYRARAEFDRQVAAVA